MTINTKGLYSSQYVPATDTVIYTVPASTRCIIDKVSVSNSSGGSATFTANLIASGGSAAPSNVNTPAIAVPTGSVYLCSELVGQTLNPGDTFSVKASVASALVIRFSGREVT